MYVIIHTSQLVFLRISQWNGIQRGAWHTLMLSKSYGNHYCCRAASSRGEGRCFCTGDAGSVLGSQPSQGLGRRREPLHQGALPGELLCLNNDNTPASLGQCPGWGSADPCCVKPAAVGEEAKEADVWMTPLTSVWTHSSFPWVWLVLKLH